MTWFAWVIIAMVGGVVLIATAPFLVALVAITAGTLTGSRAARRKRQAEQATREREAVGQMLGQMERMADRIEALETLLADRARKEQP